MLLFLRIHLLLKYLNFLHLIFELLFHLNDFDLKLADGRLHYLLLLLLCRNQADAEQVAEIFKFLASNFWALQLFLHDLSELLDELQTIIFIVLMNIQSERKDSVNEIQLDSVEIQIVGDIVAFKFPDSFNDKIMLLQVKRLHNLFRISLNVVE